MTQSAPQFATLSSLNPTKIKKTVKQIRPGHYEDYLKVNPWRTLHNY